MIDQTIQQDDRTTIEAIEEMMERVASKTDTIIEATKRDAIEDRVADLLTAIRNA